MHMHTYTSPVYIQSRTYSEKRIVFILKAVFPRPHVTIHCIVELRYQPFNRAENYLIEFIMRGRWNWKTNGDDDTKQKGETFVSTIFTARGVCYSCVHKKRELSCS